MLDKIKDWIPQVGALVGILGFGKAQGILVGIVATMVFFAGVSIGQKIGFREGYLEGQKSCKPDEEGGRRPWWPWRGEEIDLTPFEAAEPLE